MLESILEGARGRGCAVEHHLVTDSDGAGVSSPKGFTGIASDEDSVNSLARHATQFDHIIIAASGTPREAGSPMALFVKACYSNARWLDLATLVRGAEADISLASDGSEFRFTAPARPITGANRGLVIYQPSNGHTDHDGPWSEDAFFALEEVERLLGFMPSGRILATGLFSPPLEDNPVLRRQTVELGRNLVPSHSEPATK